MAKLLVGLAPIRCSSSSSANSVAFSAGNDPGVIPCSNLLQTSNNIIQKGLAFVREQSGNVTACLRRPHPAAAGRAQLHPQRRRRDQRRGPLPTERGGQHREGFERRDRRSSRQRRRPRHGQRRSPVSAVLYDQGVRHGHGIVDLPFDHRSAWRARGGRAQRRCRRDLSVHLAGATSEGTGSRKAPVFLSSL